MEREGGGKEEKRKKRGYKPRSGAPSSMNVKSVKNVPKYGKIGGSCIRK